MLTEEALREVITRTSAELAQAEAAQRANICKVLENRHLPSAVQLDMWFTTGYRKRPWRKAYRFLEEMTPRQALDEARKWAEERLASAARVNLRTTWQAAVKSAEMAEYARFLQETEEM